MRHRSVICLLGAIAVLHDSCSATSTLPWSSALLWMCHELCVLCMQAERTARDMAATAAAAEQKSASLEAALEEQEDVYENEVACLTMQLEQVSSEVVNDSVCKSMRRSDC